MSYYIDLFDPSGFTYSLEENDRNLNRTLRFEEGLVINVPNWKPKLLPENFWEVYNAGSKETAERLISVDPFNGFSVGYNKTNYGSMAVISQIAVSLYVDPDNPGAGLQPSSLVPVYGPARSYAIPSITIPGHIECNLLDVGVIDSTSAHNYINTWYRIGQNPDLQYFQDDEYQSYGIALYPPLSTKEPKDIGVERDKETGDILGVIQAGMISIPPPMVVQSVNAFTFVYGTGFPATITVDSADLTFIGLPSIDVRQVEGGIVPIYPTVIGSSINSNAIFAQLHGISTSDFTCEVFQVTNEFIAQSNIVATQVMTICHVADVKYQTTIIDSELSTPVCIIQNGAYLKRTRLNIENFLYADNILGMQDCEININSTPGNLEIIAPIIRYSTLFSEKEQTINDAGDTVTEYPNQYTKTDYRYYGWSADTDVKKSLGLSRQYNLVLDIPDAVVNCTIQASEALIAGTLTDCSLSISDKLTIDNNLTLSGGTHDIRMFEPVNNGRLSIDGATVNLYSDKLLEIADREFLACTSGDARFKTPYALNNNLPADCSHYLDIDNNGTLNISSTNTLNLDTNNGIINVENSLQLITNNGTVNGGYVFCVNNNGAINTANGSVVSNYGSLIGQVCTVDRQYANENTDITAYLTIYGANFGGLNLSINATFERGGINMGYVHNAIFADNAINRGSITGIASFVDDSINETSLSNISVALSNNALSVASSISSCDLSIGQDATCLSDITDCTVSMSRGNIANKSTNGCTMQLRLANIAADNFSNNTVEANACSIYSTNPGRGNTIILNNGSVLGGKFHNYSLPTNPKGDCPGPPNPYANPNECTPEAGCNGCWYNACWNQPDPPNNGGSIIFDRSTNRANINDLSDSYPNGCIGSNSSDPNVGYVTVRGVDTLVSVVFNNESVNLGQVNQAIFNRGCINRGIAINSIFNNSSIDTPLNGNTGGNNTYNTGSTFNGNRINGGIVNGGTINILEGGTIQSISGGLVYYAVLGGPQQHLFVREMDGGTIHISATSGVTVGVDVFQAENVTIHCEGDAIFEISVGSGNNVTITSSSGGSPSGAEIVYLTVYGLVNNLNLSGNIVLDMNGGFSPNINNDRVLWNLSGFGFVNNNGVLYTGRGMGKTSGGGVKICLYHMSPSASIPITYNIGDPDCAVPACLSNYGWVCCADIRTAIATRFPDRNNPTEPDPYYIVNVPKEFQFDYYGSKRHCI